MTDTSHPDAQTVRDYLDLWNGELSKIDVVADSGVVHDSDAPEGVVRGREGVEAFVRGFREEYPDAPSDVSELVIHDGVVAQDWIYPDR